MLTEHEAACVDAAARALAEAVERIEGESARVVALERAKALLAKVSPLQGQPIDRVRWVHVSEVQANDYNPNSVALNEMRLLHTSIMHDGYTQPVVTIWDEALGKYVIVDGFHRFTTMRLNADTQAMTKGGFLPIVVIDKPINDRMASTVRHNRARGKHSVKGMANMVFEMLENGWTDAEICEELGMEADELIRLKHVTGFSKLFANVEYRKAWETRRQIKLRRAYDTEGDEGVARISAEDRAKLAQTRKQSKVAKGAAQEESEA